MDNSFEQGYTPKFDPETGLPLTPPQPQGGFDPMTGEPLGQQAAAPQPQGGFDPMTGEPLGQQAAPPQPQGGFDPMTGQPLGQQMPPQPQGGFDPMTGQPLGQQMPPRQQAPVYGGMQPQPQKNSKKGLIIGLVIGGVVLVAGLVVLILFLTGVIGGGSSSMAGYYKVKSILMGEEEINIADMAAMYGASEDDLNMGIMLNEDGTGYLSVYGETLNVTWDDKSIIVDGEATNYTLKGDELRLEIPGEGSMSFVRAGDKPPANAGVQGTDDPDDPPVPVPLPVGDDTFDISGNYALIMVGENYVGDLDGYIYIWGDATAHVYKDGKTHSDCPVNYANNMISIETPEGTWTGALSDGMMTLVTQDGESLILGAEGSTIYETWQTYLAANNPGKTPEYPDVDPGLADGEVYLANDTEYELLYYWVSPNNAENWDEPLGAKVAAGAEAIFFVSDLQSDPNNDYDIRVVIADGEDQSDVAFYGLPVRKDAHFKVYVTNGEYHLYFRTPEGEEYDVGPSEP
ncbi:MAG: hypothetical protein IK016_11830 [Lachnospiraceae bacterium]|nr:hypothetical protein [Lachnospiraceae bacterium]